jgi:hypothetical protein
MFAFIDKLDKKLNITHRNYFLTQGDSFSLTATPEYGESQEPVVDKILFKLGFPVSNCKIEPVFEKEYVLVDGVYVLKVTSVETSKWKLTCEQDETPYIYEIEVHYLDGDVETIEKAEFTVETQIGG